MQHTLYQVNSFTTDRQNGNPAGVVLDADDLNDKQMQLIAQQAGFSETAFVTSSKTATHKIRFFSTTKEVSLCGHATIATWSLINKQSLPAGDYTQETLAGILKINILPDGMVFMEQSEAKFYETIPTSSISPLLGLSESDFHPNLKPQVMSTGFRDIIVPLKDSAALSRIKTDLQAITDISKKYDTGGVHAFTILDDSDYIANSRNFGPIDGIDEEAATGTSNGAMLCYLKHYGCLKKQNLYRIQQGKDMGKPSDIYGKFEGDIVWIGGMATIIKSNEIDQ